MDCDVNTWIKLFGVFHLSRIDKRIAHEMSNNKYSIMEFVISDMVSTMILLISFLPIAPIPYFMTGFPAKGFPFFIIVLFRVGWYRIMSIVIFNI